MTRGVDDLLADLAEAADAAAELVGLGKERWDTERPLRLAGEAVIGRLGDIAAKPADVRQSCLTRRNSRTRVPRKSDTRSEPSGRYPAAV